MVPQCTNYSVNYTQPNHRTGLLSSARTVAVAAETNPRATDSPMNLMAVISSLNSLKKKTWNSMKAIVKNVRACTCIGMILRLALVWQAPLPARSCKAYSFLFKISKHSTTQVSSRNSQGYLFKLQNSVNAAMPLPSADLPQDSTSGLCGVFAWLNSSSTNKSQI